MEAQQLGRLVDVMEQLGSGDRAALFTLCEEFGGQLAAFVRRQARSLGTEHVPADEVEGLVFDVAWALQRVAGSWDPTRGALPWNWAERRLRPVVARHFGLFTDPLDEEAFVEWETRRGTGRAEHEVASADDGHPVELLDRLARQHTHARLLVDALASLQASDRNRAILLEFVVQADLGDPSPAVTVGAIHGLKSDAVRQVVHRLRRGLRRLAETEPRFAPIGQLPVVAA